MYKYLKLFIVYIKILVCLLGLQTIGQANEKEIPLDYVHTNFTTKDGLPSNETYCIYQDRRGYIWIGTDRGLVRYDGYEFITYTTLDGLLDNVILAVNEDHDGNLWYTCLNTDEVGFIDSNMNFKSHTFNSELIKELSGVDHSIIYFNEIYRGANSMFLVNRTMGYIEIENEKIDVNINTLYYSGDKGLHIKEEHDLNFVYSNYCLYGDVDIPFNLWVGDSIIHSYYKDYGRLIWPTFVKNDSFQIIYDGRDQIEINRQNQVKFSKLNTECIAYKVWR